MICGFVGLRDMQQVAFDLSKAVFFDPTTEARLR